MNIENFYSHVKDAVPSIPYANESKLNISVPFRMLMTGPSGSGKTNVLLNIIKMIGIFDKIVLLAKDLEEPLYKHMISVYAELEKKYKVKTLLAINTVADLPSVDDFDPKEVNLLIVDDMICEKEKDLAKIAAFWIRGRKKCISSVFLSQSYFRIPKLIRENSNYVIIKKSSTPKDLKRLLSEFPLDVDIKQLMQLYSYAMDGDPHTSFFMIDTVAKKKSLTFRKGFAGILPD